MKSKYGDSTTVDFDLAKVAQQQAATAQANTSGQVTEEQAKGMSKEQKAQYEAALKQRSEAMKKNKALNDAFNAGPGRDEAGSGRAGQNEDERRCTRRPSTTSTKPVRWTRIRLPFGTA